MPLTAMSLIAAVLTTDGVVKVRLTVVVARVVLVIVVVARILDLFADGFHVEAIDLIDKAEGLHLETTYTGKGLAALVADARSGALEGKQVAFWNTYNSRPYPADVANVDTSDLPEELQRYL